jgi:hypothetical protein
MTVSSSIITAATTATATATAVAAADSVYMVASFINFCHYIIIKIPEFVLSCFYKCKA